jgi:hypothetical protein
MERRKPLKRKTPLTSTSELKRTGRLKPASTKRAKLLRERRAVIERVMVGRSCEAHVLIAQVDQRHVCARTAVDVHEPLTRARGGSIVDPSNMIPVCRSCHDWIHAHPKDAQQVGLLLSRYGKQTF